ncbi:MAG: hypothetical protein KAG97_01370 [Victivallales bacterium]|nr:hypothetical protein [Victivallales bacterium]
MEDNETNNEELAQCPSSESLSAYFDGESPPDSADGVHIAACPECAARLKVLTGLADELKNEIQSLRDDEFIINLQKSLRQKIKRDPRSQNMPFPFFMKVAAMFAGAAIVVIALTTDEKKAYDSISQQSVPLDPIVFLGDSDSPPAKKMTSLPVPTDGPGDGASAIDISDLTPVGTGEGRIHQGYRVPVREDDTKKPEVITGSVRQTWSVSNLEVAERKFKKLLPATAEVSAFRDGDDSVILKVLITKKELARLVASCSEAGFALLSPAQPQPEQKLFKGEANSKVSYTAVFVAK